MNLPYLIGPSPIRRTLQYLQSGKLIFKDLVKIMIINYNGVGEHHQGARDFAFWDMCHIQYKNPNVQILQMRDMTPTPFLRFWLDTGEDVIMDVFGKTNKEILSHVIKIFGKSEDDIKKETIKQQGDSNVTANFGHGCDRFCICTVTGQLPCPTHVPLPKIYRGKYRYANNIHTKKF